MRVAVLSDIHANLVALEAVLAEPDVRSADRVVLLGDIAVGPVPVESLDLLASLGDRAVWVHGNCERELLAAYDGTGLESPNAGMAVATAALLQPRHRELIDGLPLTVTLDVDGLGPVLFCHATPRRDDDFVLVDSPVPVWRRALEGVEERTVVMGHTHMPFDRLVDRRRVVNAGSVGMSYGTDGAAWALLGPTVQLRTTAVRHRRGRRGGAGERLRRRARSGCSSTSSSRPATPTRSRCSARSVDPLDGSI